MPAPIMILPMSDILLFLQLPQLDNVVAGPHENLYLAAAYLDWAVQRSPLGRDIVTTRLPPELDMADDDTLLHAITSIRPRYLACTLYLWNIERSLHLMRRVKHALPDTLLLAGGPEVARPHPLLEKHPAVDVAVVGEGEWVLPAILAACQAGRRAAFSCAAWKTGARMAWGRAIPPEIALAHDLPPPDWPGLAPDEHGMAYVETSRGCPMRCTYCRYHHLRRRVSLLAPEAVADRVRLLRAKGAGEIRFVDPTFNAHPRFTETLRLLAKLNRDRKLAFFAELRADRLTPGQADLLAAARFTDIETGVQSLDPHVLRTIRRPSDPARIGAGVRLLTERGIKVTLDLMVGLPYQTRAMVEEAIEWAMEFPSKVHVQFMHLLMLPGTELRRQAGRFRMRYDPLPPYAVRETPWMSRADFLDIENRIATTPRLRADHPTARLIDRTLPDLFAKPAVITVPWPTPEALPAGPRSARQAWIFRGDGLYAHRNALCAAIQGAIRTSPHTLWQFVLEPETEEPLDLLDALIAEIRSHPPMIVDRYPPVELRGLIASRRILIRLRNGRNYDPDWVEAARDCLEAAFF